LNPSLPAALIALSVAACETAPSKFGPGLHLQLRVADAQLVRGGLGADQGGPGVSQVLRPQPEASRGDATVMLNGRLGPGGVALHIQAVGDDDHWILPAKGFDFVVMDELRFSARLELSHAIQADELRVRLQAADADGRLGPITETSFAIAPDVPPARLLISLGWDAPADVDLYVADPNGVVIGSKNVNSYEPPPGQVPPSDAWMSGGWIDYDSNQHCELDLLNRENVMWLNAEPPPGRYRVYAHLFSPCGQPLVNMITVVQRNGELLGRAGATQYEIDSRAHPVEGETPGLLLLEIEVQ
jgi:hypothetical protein